MNETDARKQFLIEKFLNNIPFTDEELDDWNNLFSDNPFGDDDDDDYNIFNDV